MVAENRRRRGLGGVCAFLAFSASGHLCFADSIPPNQVFPVVARYRGEGSTRRVESPVRDVADAALAAADGERVLLNSDGSISFECPKAICEGEFFFGRSNVDENGTREPLSSASPRHATGPSSLSSRAAVGSGGEASVSTAGDDDVPRENLSESETLKDLSEVFDMSWLGVDEEAHKLGFAKGSTCGGLYSSGSQLPPATADLACSVAHLDAHSVYLKRLQSNRFRIGKGIELAIKMSGTFTLDARDRLWRKKLAQSTSLRMLVFLTRAFGRLKPNLLKTNPGAIMNQILLKRKHLYYPLTELCLFIKACGTDQQYPERLLQGYPNHVHPNDPSYLQLPMFAYLRRVGAEVAFPRDAPTLFEPRIYDGNKPVDRKQGPSKVALFGVLRDLIGHITHGHQSTKGQAKVNYPTPSYGSAQQSETVGAAAHSVKFTEDADIQMPEVSEEYPPPKPSSATKDAWKKRIYLTWHNLWLLNILVYQASDLWPWVQNHRAETFAFPPWKVKFVGVLRTTEVAPMRWRDLSPRFSVEPFGANDSETAGTHSKTAGKQGFQHPSNVGGSLTSTRAQVADAHAEYLAAFRSAELSSDSGLDGEPGFQSEDEPFGHGSSYSHKFPSFSPFSLERGDSRNSPDHLASAGTGHVGASPTWDTDKPKRRRRRGAISSDSEAIESLVEQIERLASLDIASQEAQEPPPLPEGCSPVMTDMSFFKKAGHPHGRLRVQGPALLKSRPGEFQSDQGSGWRPKVQGSEVECPPQLHPDTCGLTAAFNRPYESPWIWLLERDEKQLPKDETEKVDYPDLLWIFRGTFSSKLWIINSMGVAVPYRPLSKVGRFHYGITFLFDKAVRHLMDRQLRQLKDRLAARTTPLTIVFSGHSLGAAIAELSSWYFAKRARALIQQGKLIVRTVVFASPSTYLRCSQWGDAAAYEDMHKSGALTQEVNLDIDPVCVLFGEESLTGLLNKKPFQMQLHVEDMDQVEVASSIPGEPPFSGRVWTRPIYRPTPLLKKLAAMVFNLEDVDVLLLDPGLSHVSGYTAALTIMAGLLDEASFGSGVAAPFISDNSQPTGHALNQQLKAAHKVLQTVLRRVEADRMSEE
ncbi:hypothetical protein Emag_003999 [Eimeria magna]